MRTFLIIFSFFCYGCNTCTKKIYGVNELGYINIVFHDCNIKGSFLMYYIDSVRNKNVNFSDTIISLFFADGRPSETERIIQFIDKPEEIYVLSFDARQPWVEYLYNRQIRPNDMIRKRKILGKDDIMRITRRIQDEIIDKAIIYARDKNIPDSIVYYGSVIR